MGLRPNHARMKIQSLPLTRERLGGGRLLRLLFSQQVRAGLDAVFSHIACCFADTKEGASE
jgi:hypothetical protein